MLPASLNDVVLTNPAEARHLERLVTGELCFPSHAKSGVLLHGKYGTGKTTLAHLLAALLEYQHADEADKEAYDWHYNYRSTDMSITPENTGKPRVVPVSFTLINCGKHHSNGSNSVVKQIESISNRSLQYGCVAGSFNHFVLDELDSWSDAAQANLKGLMTDSASWNVFYVTTNRRCKIDEGIVSRTVSLEMNGGAATEHLRLLRQHLPNVKAYTDDELLTVVSAARGDWRELEDAACRL